MNHAPLHKNSIGGSGRPSFAVLFRKPSIMKKLFNRHIVKDVIRVFASVGLIWTAVEHPHWVAVPSAFVILITIWATK